MAFVKFIIKLWIHAFFYGISSLNQKKKYIIILDIS